MVNVFRNINFLYKFFLCRRLSFHLLFLYFFSGESVWRSFEYLVWCFSSCIKGGIKKITRRLFLISLSLSPEFPLKIIFAAAVFLLRDIHDFFFGRKRSKMKWNLKFFNFFRQQHVSDHSSKYASKIVAVSSTCRRQQQQKKFHNCLRKIFSRDEIFAICWNYCRFLLLPSFAARCKGLSIARYFIL